MESPTTSAKSVSATGMAISGDTTIRSSVSPELTLVDSSRSGLVKTASELGGKEIRGPVGGRVVGLVRCSVAIWIASESDFLGDSALSGNGTPSALCPLDPLPG